MNKLTNKLFLKMIGFAEASSVIAHVADKLLNYVLLKDDAAAYLCWRKGKNYCQRISRYVGQEVYLRCCLVNGMVRCNPKATGKSCNPGV